MQAAPRPERPPKRSSRKMNDVSQANTGSRVKDQRGVSSGRELLCPALDGKGQRQTEEAGNPNPQGTPWRPHDRSHLPLPFDGVTSNVIYLCTYNLASAECSTWNTSHIFSGSRSS
jgi:hypothetical protein